MIINLKIKIFISLGVVLVLCLGIVLALIYLKEPVAVDKPVPEISWRWEQLGNLENLSYGNEHLVTKMIQSKNTLYSSDDIGWIYAATSTYNENHHPAYGGIFRSKDGGNNWEILGDLDKVTFVFDILETADGAFYIGITGPPGEKLAGVLKSDNGGETWAPTGEIPGAAAVLSLLEGSDHRIYAGTIGPDGGHVFWSDDSGLSWNDSQNKALGVDEVRSLLETDNGVLYAGGSAPEAKILKSTDRGVSWIDTNVDLPGARFIYSMIQSSEGIIFAGTGPSPAAVYKSTDQGLTWSKLGDLSKAEYIYSLIEVDRNDIYVATANYVSPKKIGNVYKLVNDNWIKTGSLEGAQSVRSLLKTKDGRIFAGTGNEGGIYIMVSKK